MLIGCYYYPWYRKNWLVQTIRKSDPPTLGEYDNTVYGPTIDSHMEQMKQAGINFMSISWANDQVGHILDAANKSGIKVTYFVESLRFADEKWRIKTENMSRLLESIRHIKDDMNEDCWLRIDNRPVLMFYVTRNFDNADIVLPAIRKELPDVFIVGDEYFWSPVPDDKIQLLDAVTAYNMYQAGRFTLDMPCITYLANCKTQMEAHAEQCKRLNKPLWGNAMPGYDDSGVRPDKKHPAIPRKNGWFFEQSLADAKAVSVSEQAMMITSFNEWYEDSQIEPATSYGTKYLDILRGFQ